LANSSGNFGNSRSKRKQWIFWNIRFFWILGNWGFFWNVWLFRIFRIYWYLGFVWVQRS
jgi:hypothetical protein